MKAACVIDVNKLEVVDIEKPKLCPGEALIKIKYTGICGSDLHVLHGNHPTAKFPVVLGHEFVGEIVELCGNVNDTFKIGDIVVAQPYFSCGNCEPCARGRDNVCSDLKFMGAHINGGFAEYVKVLIRKMYKVPKNVDLKLAAMTEPIAVAVHDVRRSGLKLGQNALVIGGGPIGMLIAIVARHAGAGQVIVAEINPSRRKFAEDLGFRTLNPLEEDYSYKVMEVTKGKGYDVVYEVSGSKAGIASATEYVKIAGTILVIGMAMDKYPVDLMKIFIRELDVKGVRIHSQDSFMGAIDLLEQGNLNKEFSKLISDVYSFSDVKEAFDYAQSGGDFFKILVKM